MSVGRERRKFEDTKGIIRNCKSKKDRQYNGQKRKDKKDRQYNGQKRNDNRTNNDPQNSTQKIKIEQHHLHENREFSIYKSISPTRL